MGGKAAYLQCMAAMAAGKAEAPAAVGMAVKAAATAVVDSVVVAMEGTAAEGCKAKQRH